MQQPPVLQISLLVQLLLLILGGQQFANAQCVTPTTLAMSSGVYYPSNFTCATSAPQYDFTFDYWTPQLYINSGWAGKNPDPTVPAGFDPVASVLLADGSVPTPFQASCYGAVVFYPYPIPWTGLPQTPGQRSCVDSARRNTNDVPANSTIYNITYTGNADDCCKECTNDINCKQWFFASVFWFGAGSCVKLAQWYEYAPTVGGLYVTAPSAGWGVAKMSCSLKTGQSAPSSPVKSVSLALTLAYEQDCSNTGIRRQLSGSATTILPDFPDQPSATVTSTTGSTICGGDMPSTRPFSGTFALTATKTQGPIKFEVLLNNATCSPGVTPDYTGNGANIALSFNCTNGIVLKEGAQDVTVTAIYGAGGGTGRCVGFRASQAVAAGNVAAGPSATLANTGTAAICPGATQMRATFAYTPTVAYVSSASFSAALDSVYGNNATCVASPVNATTAGPVTVVCTTDPGAAPFPVSSGVDPSITLTAVATGTSDCSATTKSVPRAQQVNAAAFTGVSLTGVSGNGVCAPAASVAATFSYVGTGVGAATFTAVSVPASASCSLDVLGALAGVSTSVTVTCTPSSPWPAGTNVVVTLTAAFAAPPSNPSCPASSVSASRTVAVSAGPVASISALGTPPAVCGGPLVGTFTYIANSLVASTSFAATVPGGPSCTATPGSITGAAPGTTITASCPGTFAAGSYVITLTATYAASGGCSSSPVVINATSTVTVSDSPVGTLSVAAPPASICSGSTQALATFVYSVGATAASTTLTAQSTEPGASCTTTPSTITGAASNQNVLVSCTKSPALTPGTTMTISLSAQYTAVASCGGSPGSASVSTSVAVPPVPAVTLTMASNPAKCSPTTSVLATFTYSAVSIGATSFQAASTTPGLSCSPSPGTLAAIGAATSNTISVTCISGSNIPEGSVAIALTASFGAAGSCSASSVVGSTTVAVAGSAGPSIALNGPATTDCYLARSVSKIFRLTNVGSTVLLTPTLDGSSAGCSVLPASVTADGLVTVTCNATSGLLVGAHPMVLTGAYGPVGSCVLPGSTAGSATVTVAPQPTLTVAQNGVPPPACSTGGATTFVTTATYTVTGAGSSPIVTVISATPSAGGGTCTGSVTTPGAASGTVSLNCTGTFAATTDVVVSMQLSAQAGPACGTVFANGTSAIRVAVTNDCSNFCYLLVQPLGATSQCLNGKELLASFRYIAYGTTARVQFAPRTAPPFASCTVNPPYADGVQAAPGLLVTARCVWPDGSFFSPGPNPVTLAANVMTDLASCGGSVSVSGTSVVVIPQVKLTQTMVYRLGVCDKDTSARIAYSYAVTDVAANSIQFFQPKVTTSSPQLVTCSPTVTTNPDGLSGNMVIDCTGKFQGPGLNVSVLLAAQPFGCSQDVPVGAASYFIGVGPCDVTGCNGAPSGGGAIWDTGCAGKLVGQTCSGRCDMAAGVTGTAVATCSGATGLWTITTPCTPIRNGTALSCVSAPTGGFADWSSSCPGTAVGNTCSGLCLNGYSAAGGSPGALCGVDGTFVITTPCTKNGGSTTPPTWTSQPQDRTVDATTVQGTVVIFSNPTASDSTGIPPAVVCTPASGALFPAAQTTTVACVATNTAGLTATTSFKVTVRPFNTIQCLNQPPLTPPNSEWRCNQPTNSGTWCTANCVNGATPSNPPLAALCSAGVWSINAGSCDGGAPQSAYYFVVVGLSQSSLTAANLAEFQAALWEALGRSIPLESIVVFVPSFASRADVRRAANRAKAQSPEVTAASTPGNAVIGVKFLADVGLPSQAQLDAVMRSQATTVTLANSLAQAGSSLAGPASSSNSLGASDSTGNLLNSATPIVNCPVKLVRAAAAMPTCLNAVELTATFTYTADVTVNGLTTFAGAVPSITNANCKVSPRTISGPRTTGATLTVACSRADNTAFPKGSSIIYLTTKTLGGSCAGSAAASAAIPAPSMTMASPDEITQCGPVKAGSVTINFPYTVLGGPSVDAGTYLFILPSVSTSSSGVSCKPDIKPGTGKNTGVVPVTCTGRFPVSSLDVTLKLSVKQQNCLSLYGVSASATAKVVTRCCPDTSKSGPAYLRGVLGSSRCANEAATCEEGGKAFVARGPGSGTLQQGPLLASCGTSGLAQVATVSASCSGSNMLFNVTNFKESAGVSLKFWVACNRPVGLPGTGSVTSSVCAGWRQLPISAAVTGNDKQTSTSWAWPLAAGTCQCNQLYWSVFETSSQYSLPPVGC